MHLVAIDFVQDGNKFEALYPLIIMLFYVLLNCTGKILYNDCPK